MIYQRVTRSDFRDVFHKMGRGNNFSYEGLGALYDYLDEIDCDYELDVIGLCCEFTESSLKDALKEYDCTCIEDLGNYTVVIHVDDETIIYQNV